MYTLENVAEALGLEFSGDGARTVSAVAPLATAKANDLSFLADKKHFPLLASTQAGAVILHPEHAGDCPVDYIVSSFPYLSYARASGLFNNAPAVADEGIHPSAVVSTDARIHGSAVIGPNVVVEPGAVVSANVILGAGVYVGHECKVGAGTRVHPNVVLYHNVTIGRDCVIHSQAVLGADGFGFAPGPQGWEKIHQLGGLRIGDRVEIGASTTIDRGALDDTVIGDGVIIDNLVQIAHNCRIGKNTALAGCVGLAGSTIIGDNCTLSGGVGVVGHLEICDNVHITGMAMVTRSISEPGSYSSGTPMSATSEWKRNAVRFSQLDSIQKRLTSLEKKHKSH